MRILITTANRCPQGILWAPHFRDDTERQPDHYQAAVTPLSHP